MKRLIFILLIIFTGCQIRKEVEVVKVEDRVEIKKVTEQGLKLDYYTEDNKYVEINGQMKGLKEGKNEFYLVENQIEKEIRIVDGFDEKSYSIERDNYNSDYSVSHEEYLLLSLLSYAHFTPDDIGKNLYDLLNEESTDIIPNISIFSLIDLKNNWQLFIDHYEEYLKEWNVLELSDNTRENSKGFWDDGFYSIAFNRKSENGNTGKIVIAYRGSEFYPAREAFKDFIRTDFFIGLGSKPSQFEEGVDFYKDITSNYYYKNVSITGHSLGGGIAQYVAAMSQRVNEDLDYIPRVVSFNAIGILVKDMIKIVDYIDFKEHIEEDPNVPEYLRKHAGRIANVFKTELPKDVNLQKYNKGKSSYYFFHWFNKRSLQLKLKIAIIDKVESDDIKYVINRYYSKEFLDRHLKIAAMELKRFENNSYYSERVSNYIHSRDFTGNFFPHLGSTYVIDRAYGEKENIILDTFVKSSIDINLGLVKYHQPDVFFPYLDRESYYRDRVKNNISPNLNKKYVAMYIRKLMELEKSSMYAKKVYENNESNRNIVDYYKLKNELIKSLSLVNNIYKTEVITYLESQELNEFETLWEISLDGELPPIYNIFNI